ncbi:hypothetical protein PLICRDRAFT_161014 [Plicaturopsis crispa FD-325 SS-3]|nr:hypothetical protein PLICRDRAFT_161014 [Plicaturopsis crispa FD-325 SS-3]
MRVELCTIALLGFVTSSLASASIQQLGGASVLYQNDLSYNASQSALLLHQDQSYTQAGSSCAAVNENLISNVTDDLYAQLRYLEYDGQISSNATFWITGQSTAGKRSHHRRGNTKCKAYSYKAKGSVETDCATRLPALCTQSAPPYVYGQSVAAGSEVEITSSDYTFTGFRDARSFRFLGIPFAAPPVGDLRFAPPQPYTGSKNLSALSYGPACIQASIGLGIPSENTSEDCLTLNIFTPSLPGAQSGTTKKPVAFWIYGGAFSSGTGSDAIYDGGNMQVGWASRGDVIVVTINYRLGLLGFLASATALNGSQAIQDQVAALKWVSEHIESFGGDPKRVTIFGESAGAQSVAALLGSSAAKGLFSAAISQSNPIALPYATRNVYSKAITPAVASALNCTATSETAIVQCLRAVPAADFVSTAVVAAVNSASDNASAVFDGATAATVGMSIPIPRCALDDSLTRARAGGEPLMPVVGGTKGIVDDQFIYQLGNKTLPSKVPLLIGNNKDEGTLFIDAVTTSPIPNNSTAYEGYILEVFGNRTGTYIIGSGLASFPLNETDPDGMRNGISDILGLYSWQCPLQDILSLAHSKGTFPSLYSYRLDRAIPPTPGYPAPCTPDNPYGSQKICHSEDITEVFGTSNIVDYQYNSTNVLTYNQYVTDIWISFIREYNPNPPADYLKARGRGYETTVQYSAQTPIAPYDPLSSKAIHHFDVPPSNSGIEASAQCQVLANAGFLFDHIDNAY